MTTRYEITATKNGKRIRLAFSARKTRASLVANMQHNADRIVAELGTDPDCGIDGWSAQMVALTDGTVIAFSGRTEGDFLRGQAA